MKRVPQMEQMQCANEIFVAQMELRFPDWKRLPMILNEMRLKENLKHYLAKNEISAAQLSRKCKSVTGIAVPKATISNWLAGGSVRRLESLFAVSRVLGVTVDELLFGQPEQRKPQPKSKDKTSMIDMMFDDGEGWMTGRFEIKLRRLKADE